MIVGNQRSTKSGHTNSRNPKSSLDMNDTMESYKNYYEDKIVEIFDELERIRGEYTSLIEKIGEENGDFSERPNTKELERIKSIAQRISMKGPQP